MRYSLPEPALRREVVLDLDVKTKIIFGLLGYHDRIVAFKGEHEDKLLLKYMPNGPVADYMRISNPLPPLTQRLKWALQAAETVTYIHKEGVLHCDISCGNLLLDKDLNIKLWAFQGRLLRSDGTVLLDASSAESVRSAIPRPDPTQANRKTDIFTLASATYFTMISRPPFSELDSWNDREEFERRFKIGQFPSLGEVQAGGVVKRCWAGRYESADKALDDLKELCKAQSS